MPENPWDLTRERPDDYEEWQTQVYNGDTLLGFKTWVENKEYTRPLTPYDTGTRCEPKVWGEQHRESAADFGKVDFNDDVDYTVATLWIGRKDDGSYLLEGYANEKLEVEISDQS